MLGFQTFHQWVDHQWEQHAHEDEGDEACNLCDWNLQAFLHPGIQEFKSQLFPSATPVLVEYRDGLQELFFADQSGRGPPMMDCFSV